jgi:hypothetical protein
MGERGRFRPDTSEFTLRNALQTKRYRKQIPPKGGHLPASPCSLGSIDTISSQLSDTTGVLDSSWTSDIAYSYGCL